MAESEAPAKYNQRHGGPYDRGTADAYYRRGCNPHYFKGSTYMSDLVTELTDEERQAYVAGYNDQVASGDFKDWG